MFSYNLRHNSHELLEDYRTRRMIFFFTPLNNVDKKTLFILILPPFVFPHHHQSILAILVISPAPTDLLKTT